MAVTLVIKKVQTAPLKVTMALPGVLHGYFTAHAVIRSKPQNKELLQQIEDGEFDNKDEELLRTLFTGFNGIPDLDTGKELEGDEAWDAVLSGPLSSFLSPAAVQSYFEQYGEARQGNSKRRR